MPEVLMDPQVLLTFLATAIVAGVIIWILNAVHRRQMERALSQQRGHQEAAVNRVLDSMTSDKEKLTRTYEEEIRERDTRIAVLEKEISRLRDRLTQGGLLSLFGKGQREAVSALLLENEQLHEQLARQQEDMREMVGDLTGRLMDRLDRQYEESTRAVRYKQALLSTFLQQEEARQLLDRMIAEGKLAPGSLPANATPPPAPPAEEEHKEDLAS